MKYSLEDLEWALWFMSEAEMMKRIDDYYRAPQDLYDRYDAIVAAVTAKREIDTNQLTFEV